MLTDDQRQLWEVYLAVEGRAPRAEKLRALNAFLDELLRSPSPEWFSWARLLAEQVIDHGYNLVVRRPLFERAVFPALLAGYQARLPGSARWLAGFADQLQRSPACRMQLAPDDATELGLLRAAVRHDPTDRCSRLRLLDKIADQLRYSIHEVPSGILYGIDGASPQQCQELERELAEFCRLAVQEDRQQLYDEMVRACRLHFRCYRAYLLHREKYASYAAYLSRHGDMLEG